jgi:hypothetical protein
MTPRFVLLSEIIAEIYCRSSQLSNYHALHDARSRFNEMLSANGGGNLACHQSIVRKSVISNTGRHNAPRRVGISSENARDRGGGDPRMPHGDKWTVEEAKRVHQRRSPSQPFITASSVNLNESNGSTAREKGDLHEGDPSSSRVPRFYLALLSFFNASFPSPGVFAGVRGDKERKREKERKR